MNKELRQDILNKLKSLLNEQEAQQGVFGGTFSDDLDDILEDINDANIKEIAGFKYIDLTTMEDSTDEGELSLFIKSFKDVSELSQLQDPVAMAAINTICRTNILLINSVGPTDTYFYVSCKKVSDSLLQVPVSATKVGLEGEESTFAAKIAGIKKGFTPATPATPATPSTGSETGNFCDDPKNEGKTVPGLTQRFVCKNKTAVNVDTSPSPGPSPSPNRKLSCKRCRSIGLGCPDSKHVREIQAILAKLNLINVSENGFGPSTHDAVIKFQTAKKLEPDGIVGQKTCLAMGLMKRRKKVAPAPAAPTPPVTSTPPPPVSDELKGLPNKGPLDPLEESVDFYDKKKLLEAKKIFGRLIKALL